MTRCEVAVVGAGPAGSLAARALALRGHAVILCDRATFPRYKVCGGCLHPRALAALERASLGDLPRRLGARPVETLRLAVAGRWAELPLPRGLAVSREALDHALLVAAAAAGAQIRTGTEVTGTVADAEWRRLTTDGEPVEARLVLAADGLGARLLARPGEVAAPPSHGSRVGLGTVVAAPATYDGGIIHMAVAAQGYVGLVRREDGRLNVAAAVDPPAAREAATTVTGILAQAGLPPVAELASADWRGTPALTRRARPPGAERVLLLGDAAGYVEPFTGEGMAWAMEAAEAVVPLAERALVGWSPTVLRDWSAELRTRLGVRRATCAAVAWGLRHPAFVRLARWVLGGSPALARPLVGLGYGGAG